MSGVAHPTVEHHDQADKAAMKDKQRYRRRAADVQRDRRLAAMDPQGFSRRKMQALASPEAVRNNQIDTPTPLAAPKQKRWVQQDPNKTQQRRMQVTKLDWNAAERHLLLNWDGMCTTPPASPHTKHGMNKADADPLDAIPSMLNWDGMMIFSGYSVNGKPLSMSDAELV